mgnify:CR=1 FL=1
MNAFQLPKKITPQQQIILVENFIAGQKDKKTGFLNPKTFQCCRYCGECCKKTFVWLSPWDIHRIESLGHSKEEFSEPDNNLGKGALVLKKKDDGSGCIFLKEGADGTFQCSIYENRPAICRKYPFFGDQIDDCRPRGFGENSL